MAWHPQIVTTTGVGLVTDEPEFLASERFTSKRTGITLDATLVGADANGNKILKKGTCLGRITATGKYGPYSNAAGDGRQDAKGFLLEAVNLRFGDAVTGMAIMGSVIADRASGLDAAGKVDLKGAFTFQ